MFLQAVILESKRYKETSLLLHVYTKEYGFKTIIYKGVLKKKSNKHSSNLSLLSLIEFDKPYQIESKEIFSVYQISSLNCPTIDEYSFLRSHIALFLSEFLLKTIRYSDQTTDLFDLIKKTGLQLNNSTLETLSSFHIRFILEFIPQLGIPPFPYSNHLEKNSKTVVIDLMLEHIATHLDTPIILNSHTILNEVYQD